MNLSEALQPLEFARIMLKQEVLIFFVNFRASFAVTISCCHQITSRYVVSSKAIIIASVGRSSGISAVKDISFIFFDLQLGQDRPFFALHR